MHYEYTQCVLSYTSKYIMMVESLYIHIHYTYMIKPHINKIKNNLSLHFEISSMCIWITVVYTSVHMYLHDDRNKIYILYPNLGCHKNLSWKLCIINISDFSAHNIEFSTFSLSLYKYVYIRFGMCLKLYLCTKCST